MNKYNNWIKLGLDKGLTDVEIHINEKTELSLNVYKGKVEQNEISKMLSTKIKGIYNGKAISIGIEDLSDENVDKMLDHLIDSAKHITSNEPALIYEGSKEYQLIDEELFDFSTVSPELKLKNLLDIELKLQENKYLTQVQTTAYSETESKSIIVNSKGLNLDRHSTYAMIYSIGVYEKEGQIKTGVGYQIVKDFNDIDLDQIVSENINNGVSQLGAKTIKSNTYPVVINNEEFGNILSIFSDIFTGEAAFRQLTKLIGKEGTKIASDIVNLVDSPFHEKALFKVPFDGEGVACETRYWIKDGVFTSFAHNLKTAEIFKTKPTGNGFYNSVAPANLVLEPGNLSLEEVFETIEHGVYITDLSGLHAGVETVSGDFSVQASGFEIKDGKIVRPVEMIVLSGNFFELLNNIELIANDFKFGLSGVGTSAVKIKQLSVAGE